MPTRMRPGTYRIAMQAAYPRSDSHACRQLPPLMTKTESGTSRDSARTTATVLMMRSMPA